MIILTTSQIIAAVIAIIIFGVVIFFAIGYFIASRQVSKDMRLHKSKNFKKEDSH